MHTYNIVFMQTKRIDSCSGFYIPPYKIRYVSFTRSTNVFLSEFCVVFVFHYSFSICNLDIFLIIFFFVTYCRYIGCIAAGWTISSVVVFT